MAEESDAGGFLTRKQKAGLSAVAVILSILFGLQSWAILPYAVDGLRLRVDNLEKDRRSDRDLIVKLDAQLDVTIDGMKSLGRQIESLRTELRRHP